MSWFGTFGFWRRRKPTLLEPPKGLYVENFSISSQEFYACVEAELSVMKVPDLEVSRILFAEGGLLSFQREYLRMRRERLIFDVCAAPFGTSFFFSVRFSEIPVVIYPWQLLVALFLFGAVGVLYWHLMGLHWGVTMFVLNVVALFVLLRNVVELRLHRLDDFLLQLPIFGIIYEAWFRPETYYRVDTRAMYIETIRKIVERRIQQVLGVDGVQLTELESLQPPELQHLAAALKRWSV